MSILKKSFKLRTSVLSPFNRLHSQSSHLWKTDPIKFWASAAENIQWFKKPEKIREDSNHHTTWFPDGILNTTYNCVDVHLKNGHQDRIALIFDSPVTNTIRKLTYQNLFDEVVRFAGLLKKNGIQKGDRVLIYMPNSIEAVIGMLACARIGAIHSVVFGGFAANELATRIRDCKPKAVLASSCGIDGSKIIPYKPILDNAIELVQPDHTVDTCIIYQRPQVTADLRVGRDLNWEEAVRGVQEHELVKECEPVASSHPLYILYTSGTTGKPKGVLRDTGGHAVALRWCMERIYNLKPGEVFWAASDIGWVVGHSFSVYGPLLRGCASLLYEGKPVGTPDESNFWRTVERHRVSTLFTAPTAMRVIKSLDREGALPKAFDMTSLRALFLAGEHADPDTIQWAEHTLKIPVLDHWWQTETGWPVCAPLLGEEALPTKYGSCFRPCPGYDVRVLLSQREVGGKEPVNAAPGQLGDIAIKLPMPPGFMKTLYNAEERFVSSYLTRIPGYYDTGDSGYFDEQGYLYIMSRTDDVINVAGHRLSTGAMEEVLEEHHDVSEAAVVGVKDAMKGQSPLGLIVLNAHCQRDPEEVEQEVVALVRAKIGPVAAFKNAIVVKKLPKTRSGKVLRGTLRSIANKEQYTVPATVEDMDVLAEIESIIRQHEK